MPDIHPFVCLLLVLVCGLFASFMQQAARTMWHVHWWQPRRTVVACRIMAVVFAMLAAGSFVAACLYVVVGLVQLVDALYGWGVL